MGWAIAGGASKDLPLSHSPLVSILPRDGWVSLTKDAMEAFKVLKWVCMTVPILVFADYNKPFLLETDASKDGFGVVLS